MAEYPDSWAIEMQFTTSVWTDVTDDVVVADRVRFDRGIRDNSPTDRVASTGKMTLSIDNSTNNSAGLAGYYSPGHVNARSGFATGIPVRLRITYDGLTKTKFYGRIAKDGITPSPGIYGSRRTEVTVVDWMNQAATHNIKLPEYTTNKRIDEIVPLIVANMPLAPLSTSYATGVDTFPSVFDSLGENTRAISELQKLALSEYSYIYLRCTDSSDEQLVVENRNSRSNYGTDLLSVPIVSELSGHLLMETGDDPLTEDGDSILLDEVESADFTDAAINPEFSYGKHMVNVLTVTSYPRRYDDVAGTLFTLQSPVQIEASGSKTAYRCTYRDPTGGAWRVAGKNMVTPAATTHYLFNASNAGTGADLTANLAVTAAYGAEAVEYTLVNSGTVPGYVTKLEAVGEGIYLYDPVNYVAVNETSKTEHGSQELTISMTYQDDPETAEKVGALEVYNLSTPRYELDKYAFCANKDATNMMAFLKGEIGDRIHVTETQTGFDRDRYIDGIECEILPNKILMVTWRTRFVSSIDSWYVGVEDYSELGVTTYLG